jgi:transcriptional regulator with XRE-family HTH domain
MLPGLRRARTDAGYSIRGLQVASGVPRSAISLIERGKSGAQSRTVHRLAEALGVEPPALTRDPADAVAPSREEIGGMVAEARAESGRTGEPFEDVLARKLEGYSGGSAGGDEARPKKPLGTPRGVRPWLQEPLAAAAVSEDRGER